MATIKTKKKGLQGAYEFTRIESEHPLANCRPRGDRVVIQRDMPKKESAGGILLPDSASNSKLPMGTVVRVGPGKTNKKGNVVPLDLREGDRVIITNYAGMEIRDPLVTRREGDEFVILREDDVLAVID